jgi:hypothetical protein
MRHCRIWITSSGRDLGKTMPGQLPKLQNGSASDRFQPTKRKINGEIGRWRFRSVVEYGRCASRHVAAAGAPVL